MTSDRHVVLRILAQAATPLTFLIGLASAAPMGFGLGGPVAAGLMICLGAGVYGLVFGFPALAKAAPPWAMGVMLAGAAAFLLAVVLASPQQSQAWLVRLGLASEIAPAALAAQAFGVAAVACIVSAGVLMLQAIGARAQPLSIEDGP